MPLLKTITENLQAEGLLNAAPVRHVVLGYSGGADSTALLFALSKIQETTPLKVTAAYFHHGWRGLKIEELSLVHQNCVATNIPLVIIQPSLNQPKTESVARLSRYQKLTALAEDLKADAVLTAHHANDQVETILFRLLRGTGLDGLTGIQKRLVLEPPSGRPVPILRPLLDVERQSIQDYIAQGNLRYFNDPSNNNTSIERNYIRHELFPLLEKRFPQTKNALFRLGVVAESDAQIVRSALDPVWERIFQVDKAGKSLDAILFSQLSNAYQRRVLKRFLLLNDVQPDFQTIESILIFLGGADRLLSYSSLSSIESVNPAEKRFVAVYKNRIRVLSHVNFPRPASASFCLSGENMTASLPELDITLHIVPWKNRQSGLSAIRQQDSQQILVNLSAHTGKLLTLRTRQAGDKFQPIGMPSPMRFKKFLINRGVPRFDREKLPVLALDTGILWVPGMGVDASVCLKPTEKPTHILYLLPTGQSLPPLHQLEESSESLLLEIEEHSKKDHSDTDTERSESEEDDNLSSNGVTDDFGGEDEDDSSDLDALRDKTESGSPLPFQPDDQEPDEQDNSED
jgi:tRNA(Ile)-lysidine synthase